ncbi:MAG: dynamin family protein [Myxococcales bacterium]|nr:dynamin family protein [Myxococcales bacterium]
MDFVSPPIAELLTAERALLQRLHGLLEADAEAPPETTRAIADITRQLDRLFLVIFVGEFNAGKSTVVNALLGDAVMEEGPVPTTDMITVLRHGPARADRTVSEDLRERLHPAALLQHVDLVDTPGTNSIIRRHQTLTEQFIPRADLVLFVTSYDRPLSESEHQFLKFMREVWGRRLVFVLNKVDLARGDASKLELVLQHIRRGCEELMGFAPRIFPVSAELALAAKSADKQSVHDALWQQSQFAPLQDFIHDTLTGPQRMRLKLIAPLDAASRQLDAAGERLAGRERGLARDEANLGELQRRLDETRASLRDGYKANLDSIDNLMLELDRRGVRFLDETIRPSNLGLLRDQERFKREFESAVVRKLDARLEGKVGETIDRLLQQAYGLWEQVLREFAERARATGRAEAAPRGSLDYNRANVFEAMKRETDAQLTVHDLGEEARRLLAGAQEAAATFRNVQIGAAGLGIIGTVLIVTTALDLLGGLGLLTGGAAAVLGFTVLPRQRRRAIRDFQRRVSRLREELREALAAQLDVEIDKVLGRIDGTTKPYREMVERELKALKTARADHDELAAELRRLQARVDELAPATGDDESLR